VNLRLTHTDPRIQSKYRRRGSPPRVSASHFEVRTTTSVFNMQLPHPVHTFTHSHIHTFTHSHIHTHTHTNTHSHRDYSDYSDSSFDRKKGRVRDRGLAHKSDFRYADHAYSRNQSQSTRCVFAKTSRRHFHTQTPVLAPASKLQQTKVGRTNANAKPYITTYFPTHSTFTTRIHVYNIQLPHPVQNVRQTHMLAPTISGSSSI